VRMRILSRLPVLALCGLAAAAPLVADESAEHLRSAVNGYSGTYLTLRLVMEASFRGQSREVKGESPLIALEANGLLVTPNPEGPPGMGLDFKSLQVVLADGKEVEAKVVGRDADYGFLFLKPAAKDAPALPQAPAAREKALELGDEIFLVRRLSSVHPEALCNQTRIVSVLQKPRLMYLVAENSGPGCLALDAEGKLVGVTAVVKEPDPDSGQMRPLLVVLPMARVMEVAKAIQENPEPEPEKKPEAVEPPSEVPDTSVPAE